MAKSIKPYKSKFEYNQAKRLEDNGFYFEYESWTVPWKEPVNQGECSECESKEVYKNRVYTPDFFFPESKIFVETKGKWTPQARTYMSHIKKYSPYPIKMVFMFDNWCTRKHSMKYSRWCELNGMEYAIGEIPFEWIESDRNN